MAYCLLGSYSNMRHITRYGGLHYDYKIVRFEKSLTCGYKPPISFEQHCHTNIGGERQPHGTHWILSPTGNSGAHNT